jgi:site-specific DNA-methyltransferase (adenine-specific)
MFNITKIEKAYELMLEASQLLQNALEQSFFEGYIENVGNIIQNYQVRTLDGVPDKQTKAQLEKLYQELQKLELTFADWRKVSQLVLLKGTVLESIQANHQLTPDSLGFLFSYLIEQLTGDQKDLILLDNAVGMGNLMLTLLLNLSLSGKRVKGYGIDNDNILLNIAAVNAELTQVDLQLFLQDGLQNADIESVDIVMSDLPVGYYPNDAYAQNFSVFAKEAHTYAHHLLAEKAMMYLKPGGFGLFLLPTNLLQTEQAALFEKWLRSEVYLQGVIGLPENLFKSKQIAKSIFILQKPGEQVKQQEVFATSLSSLTNVEEIKRFLLQFNWIR